MPYRARDGAFGDIAWEGKTRRNFFARGLEPAILPIRNPASNLENLYTGDTQSASYAGQMTYTTFAVGQAAGVGAALTASGLSIAANSFITLIGCYGDNAESTAWTVSNDGSAITWTKQAETNTISNCKLVLWSGQAGATPPTSITVTSTAGASVNGSKWLAGMVHTGQHATTPLPLGNIFTGTTGTDIAQAITPTSAGSCLWLAAADWSQTNSYLAGTGCTIERTYNETGQQTDVLIRPTTQPRTDGSAFTLSETDTAGKIAWIAFEVQAAATGATGSNNETIAGSDSQTASAAWSAANAESAAATDSQTGAAAWQAANAETAAATDSQSASFSTSASGSNSESLATADSQTGASAWTVSESETIATADSQTGAAAWSAANAETAATADSQSAVFSGTGSNSESLATADSQTASFSNAGTGSNSETLATADSQTGAAAWTAANAESAAATDSQSASFTTTGSGANAETAATADSQSATFSGTGSNSESAATTDTQTGAAAWSKTAAETAAIGDSQTASFTVSGSGTSAESAAATDNQSAVYSSAATYADSAGVSTSQTGAVASSASQAETLAPADSQTAAFTPANFVPDNWTRYQITIEVKRYGVAVFEKEHKIDVRSVRRIPVFL